MLEDISNKVEDESKDKIVRVLKYTLFSIILTLVLLFIYSIILTYTSMPESTMPVVIITISGMSILLFSIACVRKIKNNGIVNGGIIGLIYMITIYLLSSLFQTGFNFNIYTILMIATGIACGMVGGIIGVNMKVSI